MQGVCALTNGTGQCYLAVPSNSSKGSIQISDALADGQAVAEIQAHKSPLVSIRL